MTKKEMREVMEAMSREALQNIAKESKGVKPMTVSEMTLAQGSDNFLSKQSIQMYMRQGMTLGNMRLDAIRNGRRVTTKTYVNVDNPNDTFVVNRSENTYILKPF